MRIGVDLGGTKIEVIALDDVGAEVFRHRAPTPRNDYGATLDAIAGLVALAEQALPSGPRPTVGVGIPGTVSTDTGRVKNANSTWLTGHPLDADLERHLERPVRVANDANCFALSEATDGAGRGADVVFGVIAGTGCGGGLVVHGRVVAGVNGIAGEWGHNPLPWPRADESPGPHCYCGLRGCLETWLSGPGLRADHLRRTGRDVAPDALAADPEGAATLERHADRFARGLASVINVLDPDVVVLGGGVSNLPELPSAIEARLPRYVFSDTVNTKVRRNRHGDSSGVRGAAWLWPAP